MTEDFGTETLDDAFRRVRDLDVSLSEQLRSFAENTRQERPAFAAAVDRLIDRLRRHSAGDSAPKPGEPMPGFVLPDENGDRVSLDDLLDEGPVAITFHRGHWVPIAASTSMRSRRRRKSWRKAKVRSLASCPTCRNSLRSSRSSRTYRFQF